MAGFYFLIWSISDNYKYLGAWILDLGGYVKPRRNVLTVTQCECWQQPQGLRLRLPACLWAAFSRRTHAEAHILLQI